MPTKENIWADVDYEPSEVDMTVQQVSAHVYYVQGPPGIATDNEGFMSNAGFVVTKEGIVVFDALGTPSLAHKLFHKIRAISDQPIAKVIVSHYHADHIYGLQVFKQSLHRLVLSSIWNPKPHRQDLVNEESRCFLGWMKIPIL